MKLFTKLMLAALFIAMLLPFTILKNDQGKSLMSFSDFSFPDMKLPDMSSARDMVPNKVPGGMDTFYKWYDTRGNVQFTSEPPPDGVEFTVKEYDPNANVIQAVELPVEEPAVETSTAGVGSNDGDSTQQPPNGYDKESIEKLFEDTKNIEKLLNQRSQAQNAAINQ